jgi:hypothetical protein
MGNEELGMNGFFYKQGGIGSALGAILLKQQALDVLVIRQGLGCVGKCLPVKHEAKPSRRLFAARLPAAPPDSNNEPVNHEATTNGQLAKKPADRNG